MKCEFTTENEPCHNAAVFLGIDPDEIDATGHPDTCALIVVCRDHFAHYEERGLVMMELHALGVKNPHKDARPSHAVDVLAIRNQILMFGRVWSGKLTENQKNDLNEILEDLAKLKDILIGHENSIAHFQKLILDAPAAWVRTRDGVPDMIIKDDPGTLDARRAEARIANKSLGYESLIIDRRHCVKF